MVQTIKKYLARVLASNVKSRFVYQGKKLGSFFISKDKFVGTRI